MNLGHVETSDLKPVYLHNEAKFRLDLLNDAMATDKINESLRIFLKDGAELKSLLTSALKARSGRFES